MAVIKQIAIYDDSQNQWVSHDIGPSSTYVRLSSTVYGSDNLQSALSNLVGPSKIPQNQVVVTDSSQRLVGSNVTTANLRQLPAALTDINNLNNKVTSLISKNSNIGLNLIYGKLKNGELYSGTKGTYTGDTENNLVILTNFNNNDTSTILFEMLNTQEKIYFLAGKTYYTKGFNKIYDVSNPSTSYITIFNGDFFTPSQTFYGSIKTIFPDPNSGSTGGIPNVFPECYLTYYSNAGAGTFVLSVGQSNSVLFTQIRKLIRLANIHITYNNEIAVGATAHISKSFVLPDPYTYIPSIRQITTNHNNALVITGFYINGDGGRNNQVTVGVYLRNITQAPVSASVGTTVDIEVALYSPPTAYYSTKNIYSSMLNL